MTQHDHTYPPPPRHGLRDAVREVAHLRARIKHAVDQLRGYAGEMQRGQMKPLAPFEMMRLADQLEGEPEETVTIPKREYDELKSVSEKCAQRATVSRRFEESAKVPLPRYPMSLCSCWQLPLMELPCPIHFTLPS